MSANFNVDNPKRYDPEVASLNISDALVSLMRCLYDLDVIVEYDEVFRPFRDGLEKLKQVKDVVFPDRSNLETEEFLINCEKACEIQEEWSSRVKGVTMFIKDMKHLLMVCSFFNNQYFYEYIQSAFCNNRAGTHYPSDSVMGVSTTKKGEESRVVKKMKTGLYPV